MKMYEIIAFNDFYATIATEHKLNMTTAYKINRVAQAIKTDLEFYQIELKKIFDDCVETENGQYKMTEDNQNFIVKKDKIQEFEQRYNDLRNIDVDFDESLKLDINLFDGLQVSPQEILNITNFLIS